MMLAFAFALGVFQDPAAAVAASQERRVATVARCAPAVCSVMAMDAPGGGSGVIFDPAGFVLTNYHVVGEPDKDYKPPAPSKPTEAERAAWKAANPDADEAKERAWLEQREADWKAEHHPRGGSHYRNKKVGLPDGQLYEGVVLGIDPGSDLAVLRLVPKREGQTWPHCALGDSDALLVGQTVFAMGNPFLLATDFTPTVTFGIVSGTHRYQEGQGNRVLVYPDCIQVDAPVNPGNSGGPLFNEAGEVVGINGRISIGDRGRVNVGVGFAIASNQIANFLADLVAGRHAEHGTMDMSAWFMTDRAGEKRRGVFVQQLFKDSVAAQVGIGLGDEILAFDGNEVRSANQLATMVGVLPAGAWVTVAFRQAQGENGFGEPRTGTLRLTALDTGSSQDGGGDDARLGSRHDRRIATRSLLATWKPVDEPADTAVTWSATAPDGSVHRAMAHGARLRVERGNRTLVLEGDGKGFAIESGTPRDLTAEEAERLRREAACNPMLWTRAIARERLREALLVGGAHVHGAPAYRFAIPGDGECEAWFFADGSPAGCTFRDPLRKARVERQARGAALRFVVDRELEAGWVGSERAFVPVDEAWFRRP
ncbi:MAG: trypsin-like peptidase domain-containing protein [Planctomycetes bacterium]|nr:trypsin-like peptidase domain-containing protein [Planctomycetota bacterium]